MRLLFIINTEFIIRKRLKKMRKIIFISLLLSFFALSACTGSDVTDKGSSIVDDAGDAVGDVSDGVADGISDVGEGIADGAKDLGSGNDSKKL